MISIKQKIDFVITICFSKQDDEKKIDWIFNVPKEFNIYIYNKGQDLSKTFYKKLIANSLKFKIEKLKNTGFEHESNLYHIIKNYNNLADLTIFSQAEPHIHSPDFSKLLENYKDFEDFQCLTDRFMSEFNQPSLEYLDQPHVKNKHLNGCKCAPMIFNLNNVSAILYKDLGMVAVLLSCLRVFNLTSSEKIEDIFLNYKKDKFINESITKVFLEKCGIKLNYNDNKIPEIYYYCASGCFAVRKNRILQNSLESYIKMRDMICETYIYEINPLLYLLERSWAIIFGPVYNKQTLMEDLKINNLQ